MLMNDFKVYDYMPFGTGKKNTDKCTDILWPVYCYNINVCTSENASSNVLERIVDRMLKLKNYDIAETADSLCLERDLVEFISEKLRSASDTELEECNQSVVYKIFVDRSDSKGDILPFVISDKDDLGQKTVLEEKKNNIRYAFDNEKSKIINAKLLDGIDSKDVGITPKEVIRAIESYIGSIKSADSDDPNIPAKVDSLRKGLLKPIRIISAPQKAFVHLIVTIEENNHDLIISNIKGNNIDRILSRKINNLNLDENVFFHNIKCADVENTSLIGDKNEYSKASGLSTAEYLYNKAKEIKNKDLGQKTLKQELLEKKNSFNAVIINLYRSVEEALYSLHLIYGVNAHLTLPYNNYIVNVFAQKVGIDDEYLSFFNISQYRLMNLEFEKDMQTLLYLNILESSATKEHPIIKLFRQKDQIDFMSFIVRLKKYRDMSSHDSDLQYSEDLLNEFIIKVGIIHKILDPNFKTDAIKQNTSNTIDEQWHLKARICIDSLLSRLFVQNLSIENFDWLIDLTQKYLKAQKYHNDEQYGNLQLEFICSAYKFLERLFKGSVVRRDISVKEVSDYIRQHFITKADDNLPRDEEDCKLKFMVKPDAALVTVRKAGVVKVFSGKGFSLNAVTVAFLISSDQDVFKEFIKHCERHKVNFIDLIEKIIKYRGHGSTLNFNLSCSEFESIFKHFLFIFKSYEEFFK